MIDLPDDDEGPGSRDAKENAEEVVLWVVFSTGAAGEATGPTVYLGFGTNFAREKPNKWDDRN